MYAIRSYYVGSMANVVRQSAFWNKERKRENLNIVNTNVSPALAVSWDPWGTGKTKFAASGRRYSYNFV